MFRCVRIEVHKFGGTSVAGVQRLTEVGELVRGLSSTRRMVVVSSAMSGVTDGLGSVVELAAGGRRSRALELVDELERRHLEVAAELCPGTADVPGAEIERITGELRELLRAVVQVGEATPRSLDRVLSCGEKLAVRLLAARLRERGVDAEAVDADTCLETDERFGCASPIPDLMERGVRRALEPILERGGVPVVTGFCGRAPDGATTTLGRGGSDLTATLLAGALEADEVTIWTDVDGVYSADPRVVPDARSLGHLHYREAAELSFYGAKVLHQRSMIPLVGRGIPVRVRNSFRPGEEGTLVDGRFSRGSHPVKAISAVRGQSIVSIEGNGMSGVPGIAGRVFQALADHSINVTMISQSSSESSISLAIPSGDAPAAESALKRALAGELARGEVEEIEVACGKCLIAAVGLGMAHAPGVAARVFAALGAAEINVLAIAQGSSELNISLAVDGERADQAIRAIHAEFGLHRLDTGEDRDSALDLILVGYGNIGRALAELLLERGQHVFERFGLHARVVGVADRSGYLFHPTGLSASQLVEAGLEKRAGRPLRELPGATASSDPGELVRRALEYRLSRPVLVDVSDSGDAHRWFLDAMELGCDVVSANKKPLAGALDHARELLDSARRTGRLLKVEATVGAGLPVVETLETMLAAGDRLTAAEGCLSGTLAFLLKRVREGVPLSAALVEAVEQGYTEPDPAEDLTGADVARKSIILGRLSGLVPGECEPALRGLVPEDMLGLEFDELRRRLEREVDEDLARRSRDARDAGGSLAYVGRVRPGAIAVGLEVVPADWPLGGLQGTDNRIVFHSERYHDRPLAVTGPGAGVDVTAMAVLGDILRVAAERR
jgi:aspartokinase/homoserine dehydrogenase 1